MIERVFELIWTAVKGVLKIAAWVLGAAIVVFCAWAVIATYDGRVGVVAGLLLGLLAGPARISGVDFRQWFRDPGTPSEITDDSPIGLVRGAFHALWASGLFVFIAAVISASWRQNANCPALYVPLHEFLPQSVADWLNRCAGVSLALKLIGGALVGAVVAQFVVETIWRWGLAFRLPPLTPGNQHLALRLPQKIRDKSTVEGRRRLIICCDGTWNWPEARKETNVIRLVRALTPADGPTAQIVHYNEGVGTGNFLDRLVGGGAGVGLSASVKACYGFLVDNYRQGDEIFLFGFSRGAYIARALGGLIGTVGIMCKLEMDRFAEVWNWYWQPKSKRDIETLTSLARGRHA
jgi:T6SS, Phospholipase effector Tle1-like, catalytic domain